MTIFQHPISLDICLLSDVVIMGQYRILKRIGQVVINEIDSKLILLIIGHIWSYLPGWKGEARSMRRSFILCTHRWTVCHLETWGKSREFCLCMCSRFYFQPLKSEPVYSTMSVYLGSWIAPLRCQVKKNGVFPDAHDFLLPSYDIWRNFCE